MLKLFRPAPVDTILAVIASLSCTCHWLMPSGLSPADGFATLAAECAIEALDMSATAAGPSVALAVAAVLMVASGGRIPEKRSVFLVVESGGFPSFQTNTVPYP